MDRIKNWTAKRSGGRITIIGEDAEDGAYIRVPNVDLITVTGEGIVATDKGHDTYLLEPLAAGDALAAV